MSEKWVNQRLLNSSCFRNCVVGDLGFPNYQTTPGIYTHSHTYIYIYCIYLLLIGKIWWKLNFDLPPLQKCKDCTSQSRRFTTFLMQFFHYSLFNFFPASTIFSSGHLTTPSPPPLKLFCNYNTFVVHIYSYIDLVSITLNQETFYISGVSSAELTKAGGFFWIFFCWFIYIYIYILYVCILQDASPQAWKVVKAGHTA